MWYFVRYILFTYSDCFFVCNYVLIYRTVYYCVYCLLCTVYCVLCTTVCTVYCVLCTVYCVLCTVYCVLCTVYYCVYCVLCTVYCELWTVYCVLFTVYCVLCTVYCVLCVLYYWVLHYCVLYTTVWILYTPLNGYTTITRALYCSVLQAKQGNTQWTHIVEPNSGEKIEGQFNFRRTKFKVLGSEVNNTQGG